MTPKYKKNDIILYNTAYGIITAVDEHWYFITWIGSGDGMLNISYHDTLPQMKKVAEYEPGSVDDLLLFGKMKV